MLTTASEDALAKLGESYDDTIKRWSYDFYGTADGRAEEDADFTQTRAWFSIIGRDAMNRPRARSQVQVSPGALAPKAFGCTEVLRDPPD